MLLNLPMAKRKPIEEWQLQDAQRLKAIWDKKQPGSQEKFGAIHKIGSQGLVWQYLNGYIPLNLPIAIRFANGLGVTVQDISPTLAQDLEWLPVSGGLPNEALDVARAWLRLAPSVREQMAAAILGAASVADERPATKPSTTITPQPVPSVSLTLSSGAQYGVTKRRRA